MVYIIYLAGSLPVHKAISKSRAVPAQIHYNKRGQVLLNSEVHRLPYELGPAVGHARHPMRDISYLLDTGVGITCEWVFSPEGMIDLPSLLNHSGGLTSQNKSQARPGGSLVDNPRP